MMNICVKNDGLAAFMMLNGLRIQESTATTVSFESEKTGQEWRQAYANSEYARFNGLLIEIRNLKKGT